MIIAGTGPRKLILAGLERCQYVLGQVKEELLAHSDVQVMSGMAEGFDECVAAAAVQLDLPLHAVIPNYGYGQFYWGRNSQLKVDRYHLFEEYVAYAAENGSVTYVIEDVYNTTGVYANGKHSNFLRNEVMVERADRFVALDENSKGTKHCIAAIEAAGKPLVRIE